MKPTEHLRSGLRPQADAEMESNMRLLHEQYDRMFKDIITGNWTNSSDGDVESPTGYFTLITIERAEVNDIFDNFVNEDNFTERHLIGLEDWRQQLAGHYVTKETSSGIIWVYAYDSHEAALADYAASEAEYAAWDTDLDELIDGEDNFTN